ncbi:histidine kinase [Vibrio campbellii]|uniref:response regulator n=1 Tax=Vibrio campbellii TaxID=680 RepID=UPI000DE279EE|nr:response regulator [Vibrio campbellii]AXB34528.1 histidine kinase [Vibrio campbellii]
MLTQQLEINNLNILVIDDCTTSATLIKHQLISLGVSASNVTCVHSAMQAVATVKTRFYSFIIMDYHLSTKLTGLDLINLLVRAKLISDTTAVLMISGDATQETVLTALTGRVRHFLTKPLQTKALRNKILIALEEQHQLVNAERQLSKINDLTLTEIVYLHKTYGQSVCVESLLIDKAIDSGKIDILEGLLAVCSKKDHASRICAEAFLLHQKGQVTEAVKTLTNYVTHNPLCLRAIDNLVGLHESLHEYNNASVLALRAFELTPSSSSRLMTVSRILNKLGDTDKLFDVGGLFASSVSSSDPQWLSAMGAYIDAIIERFKTLKTSNDKRCVLLKLNGFYLLAEKRLDRNQHNDLIAFKRLMQCKLLIAETNLEAAHKKLMLSLSNYYSQPNKIPLFLLRQFIPLMEFFGEFEIQSELIALSIKKSRIPLEKNDSLREPKTSLDYPYSTEIKLKKLCTSNISETNCSINESIEFLTQIPLPPNWSDWLADYLAGSSSQDLPEPFNFRMK